MSSTQGMTGMKKKRNKFTFILSFFMSLFMVIQMPVMADVMVSISLPIVIKTKLTTHLDDFKTYLPLQMTSPVVSDLDCDWVLDVVSTGYDANTKKSKVYVWARNGILKDGWPVEVDGNIENMAAVGDFDGDGIGDGDDIFGTADDVWGFGPDNIPGTTDDTVNVSYSGLIDPPSRKNPDNRADIVWEVYPNSQTIDYTVLEATLTDLYVQNGYWGYLCDASDSGFVRYKAGMQGYSDQYFRICSGTRFASGPKIALAGFPKVPYTICST